MLWRHTDPRSPDCRYNNMTVTWEQLGYSADESAVVRDMFSREDLGEFTGDIRIVGRRSNLAMPSVT